MKPKSPDHHLRDILDALDEPVSEGSFRQVVATSAWSKTTHRFSFAVGMGSAMWAAKYANTFGIGLPEWVRLEHPARRIRLCSLSIKNGMPLPQSIVHRFPPLQA
jgi:hypothetical protein